MKPREESRVEFTRFFKNKNLNFARLRPSLRPSNARIFVKKMPVCRPSFFKYGPVWRIWHTGFQLTVIPYVNALLLGLQMYIFPSQIHLQWRFYILNTIPNTSSDILLLYHTCLEVQTFIHRDDHVKTPKLKVRFRSRRSAQIELKKTTKPYFEI